MTNEELNELIDLQLRFEETKQLRAVQKFRKDNHRMIKDLKGGYLSGTAAGRALLASEFPEIAERLHQVLEAPGFSHMAETRASAIVVLTLLTPEVCSVIALKAILDVLGRETRIKAQTVITTIGSRLQDEFLRRRYDELDHHALAAFWTKHKHASTWHKMSAIKIEMGKVTGISANEIRQELPNLITNQAASFIFEAITLATGWFSKDTVRVAKNKSQTFVQLNPNLLAFIDKYHARIEENLQQALPMLCPPRPWALGNDGVWEGGYLTPVGKFANLMKDIKGKGSTVPEATLDLINNVLQPVRYKINESVFELQDTLFGMEQGKLGSFKPIKFSPLTNDRMPDHIEALDTNHPARVAWRKEKQTIHDANAESRRCGIRSVRNISAAREFSKFEQFYVPWSSGHNHRLYPLSQAALSPQGSDSERALLAFADGTPMTDRGVVHLARHVANQFGISDSHEAKTEWVERNLDLIEAVATSPLDVLGEIEAADEPWQFQAACAEYYACVMTGSKVETTLGIGLDATASGLQILALLARDLEAAGRVNLIPQASKRDVYAELRPLVVAKLIEFGRTDLSELHFPRKALKANLVSRVYGSVLRSRKQAILKVLMECYNYQKGLLAPGDGMVLALAFDEAMTELAPGALAVFDALSAVGKKQAALGNTVNWTTPTGGQVVINPTKHPIKRIKCGFWGDLNMADDSKEESLDTRKVRTSTAPLFIHSLDSAALTYAFSDWQHPLTAIHDCFAVQAPYCDEALDRMRGAYIDVVAKPGILESFLASNGLTVDDVKLPILNTLTDQHLQDLVYTEYAFC